MKKHFLLLVFIALFVQSCSPIFMPREVRTSFFDYRKYSNEGFFLSPDSYPGEFTPCGELFITIKPGDVKGPDKMVYDPGSQSYVSQSQIRREEISSDELLSIAVKKAKEIGADGLVNFKCHVINSTYYNPALRSVQTIFSHYEISGFAIKRK